MPKLDLSFSANFLQQTFDLRLSGNLDLSLFSQFLPESLDDTFPGNLELIPRWQNKILFFPQIFSRIPQILGSLEI